MNPVGSYNIGSTSSATPSRWLLKRVKLQEIASQLEGVNQRFAFSYRDVAEEQLPDLQEYCFISVFEMCERGEKDAVKKIQVAVRGLRDLSGNTIFFKFIRDGKEAKEPKILTTQLNLANALSDEKYKCALHQALKTGKSCMSLKIIKLQGHGTPLQLDHKGRMPIHIAAKNNRADAINALLPMTLALNSLPMICLTYHSNKKNRDLCPMSLAVMKGHISCVDELVRGGVVPAAILKKCEEWFNTK